MLLQDIFRSITVSVFKLNFWPIGNLQSMRQIIIVFICTLYKMSNINYDVIVDIIIIYLSLHRFQCEVIMRTVEQDSRGSTTSRVQKVRTGVLLVMIRMVRMMRGAGARQVLGGTMTGGAPQAQVGTAQSTLPIHLSLINVLVVTAMSVGWPVWEKSFLFHSQTAGCFFCIHDSTQNWIQLNSPAPPFCIMGVLLAWLSVIYCFYKVPTNKACLEWDEWFFTIDSLL